MKQEYLRLKLDQLINENFFIRKNKVHQDLYFRAIEQALTNSKCYCLLQTMYLFDTHLFEHCVNTSILAMFLATEQKVPLSLCCDLAIGGLFHDLGKLLIPQKILQKPGHLTEDEWKIMRLHPKYGYAIIRPMSVSSLVLDVILYHHCGYNFDGYPKIIFPSAHQWRLIQMVTLADAFDAMASKRTYRESLPLPIIYREIKNTLGRQFDPVSGNFLLDLLSQAIHLKKGEVLQC